VGSLQISVSFVSLDDFANVMSSPRSMTWNSDARSWNPSGLRAVIRKNRLILDGEKNACVSTRSSDAARTTCVVERDALDRRVKTDDDDGARARERSSGARAVRDIACDALARDALARASIASMGARGEV